MKDLEHQLSDAGMKNACAAFRDWSIKQNIRVMVAFENSEGEINWTAWGSNKAFKGKLLESLTKYLKEEN